MTRRLNSFGDPPSVAPLDPPRIYRAGTLRYTSRGLIVLCCWLLWGDMCFQIMEQIVPTIMPLILKSLGASDKSIGLIQVTLPQFITLGVCSAVSFKSDRYRSRWGRRIPFIVVTMPPLVLCLCALGFTPRIVPFLNNHPGFLGGRFSAASFAIVVVAALMVLFTFFNDFVASVFYYLFNDVVPEQFLARFISWFRAIALLSTSAYNFFVFRYAETHTAAIFIGAAILYAAGFGLMCWKVREGNYPPPPPYVAGETGPLAATRTFLKECHGLRHYWIVFFVAMASGGLGALGPFGVFLYKSTGMDDQQVGYIRGASGISTAFFILLSGWLADIYHPIRLTLIGLFAAIFVSVPAQLIWLFWYPPPAMTFWVWIFTSVLLSAPVGSMVGMLDPPMLMRIFPRSRYGQFCSANALWRAISTGICGFAVGEYFDLLRRHWGDTIAYRCLPIWTLASDIFMLIFLLMLYRSWKRYGGDAGYVPPMPGDPMGVVAPIGA